MKKTSILLALILAFTLTISAAADTFPDVESDHWAYEEIQDLQASGIFEGFPDGEFKGDNAFTRYEFAVAFHRALENMEDDGDVNEAVEELQDEVERLSSGLTAEQAEAVESIVEAIVEETSSDQLSEEQAKEVSELVEELTKGLSEEIEELYVELDVTKKLGERRYEDNNEKIKEIQDKVAELEGAASDEELETLDEDIADLMESVESLEEMESNVQKLGIDQESADKLSQMRFMDLREDLDQLSENFDDTTGDLEKDLNKQKVDLQSQSKLGKMRYNDINDNLDQLADRISTLEEEPTFQFVDPTYSVNY
ncbi:MAG: S-layer homology domain-containing protein, partial [Halanaerobiaceae bacterium]